MEQLAIVHTEHISRKGEIKYFQIPMPGTAKKIIAVEASAVLFSSVDIPAEPAAPTVPTPSSGNTGTSNNCPNPGKASIEPISDTSSSSTRTQVFRIGAAVNPGFVYSCGVYSVVLSVTAVDGDTPYSISTKLAAAVNNTSLASWNQYGSNTKNYKPTAKAEGELLTLTVDTQHSFFASGTGECSGTPSAEEKPEVQYDPLFTVRKNEKVGTLSLQSPNATDIFYQGEAYREDRNIGYGDFTLSGEMVGEWLKGRKRLAVEVLITTESPILEAYYKDTWGDYYGKDINYQLNIILWYEKQNL